MTSLIIGFFIGAGFVVGCLGFLVVYARHTVRDIRTMGSAVFNDGED